MGAVFVASPSAIPVPLEKVIPWSPCQHVWEAPNGDLWDLSGTTSGVRLLAGSRGWEPAPSVRYTTKSAAIDGSQYRGSITDERDVFWALKVWQGGGSQEWINHNARWWETLDPELTGRWLITQPNGQRRALRCRFTSLDDPPNNTAPEMLGNAVYGVHLVAEQPHWEGDPITLSFTTGTGQTYYGGDAGGGYGPDYFISPGQLLSDATVTNPGQKPAWPVWTVYGPSTAAQVGLDGHLVTFPITLTGGQWIRLDTDPTNQVAIDHAGVDRTAQIGLDDFHEIPPGESVPLSLTMTGTGGVDVTIRPKYRAGY